jgi:hypothetical protein
MEDLIQNVHTLFDEGHSQSPPVPSNVAEATSAYTHGSPELPQSTTQHHLGLVGGIPTSSRLSFSSSPLDATTKSRPTPPPITLLSPLLRLSSSKTLTEGLETTTQEKVVPKASARTAVETFPNSTPPDAEYNPAPDPEAGTTPQSPPESMLTTVSDFPLSSATSLQTRTWGFPP